VIAFTRFSSSLARFLACSSQELQETHKNENQLLSAEIRKLKTQLSETDALSEAAQRATFRQLKGKKKAYLVLEKANRSFCTVGTTIRRESSFENDKQTTDEFSMRFAYAEGKLSPGFFLNKVQVYMTFSQGFIYIVL